VREASLKRLYTYDFLVYEILEKVKLWKQLKVQWLPWLGEKGGMNRQSAEDA
jgi:hypothetical protein